MICFLTRSLAFSILFSTELGFIQLLCFHKMTKTWTPLPYLFALVHFWYPTPSANVQNFTSQLEYRTVPMLSQASAYISQCISKYLFPVKVSFFCRRIQQCGLVIEMMIQKKLRGFTKNGSFEYILYEGFPWQ